MSRPIRSTATGTSARTRATALAGALIATLAVTATASLAGPVASADAHYLSATDVLRFPPKAGTASRCIRRTVRLRKGVWSHGSYMVSTRTRTLPDLSSRQLRVPTAGRYRWRACRSWDRVGREYVVWSALTRGRVTVVRENVLNLLFIRGNGAYEWGGRLAFAGPFGQH